MGASPLPAGRSAALALGRAPYGMEVSGPSLKPCSPLMAQVFARSYKTRSFQGDLPRDAQASSGSGPQGENKFVWGGEAAPHKFFLPYGPEPGSI